MTRNGSRDVNGNGNETFNNERRATSSTTSSRSSRKRKERNTRNTSTRVFPIGLTKNTFVTRLSHRRRTRRTTTRHPSSTKSMANRRRHDRENTTKYRQMNGRNIKQQSRRAKTKKDNVNNDNRNKIMTLLLNAVTSRKTGNDHHDKDETKSNTRRNINTSINRRRYTKRLTRGNRSRVRRALNSTTLVRSITNRGGRQSNNRTRLTRTRGNTLNDNRRNRIRISKEGSNDRKESYGNMQSKRTRRRRRRRRYRGCRWHLGYRDLILLVFLINVNDRFNFRLYGIYVLQNVRASKTINSTSGIRRKVRRGSRTTSKRSPMRRTRNGTRQKNLLSRDRLKRLGATRRRGNHERSRNSSLDGSIRHLTRNKIRPIRRRKSIRITTLTKSSNNARRNTPTRRVTRRFLQPYKKEIRSMARSSLVNNRRRRSHRTRAYRRIRRLIRNVSRFFRSTPPRSTI